MSAIDPSTFLPGAFSRRNPQGGSANAAIPDVTPAFIGLSLGKATIVADEAVTKGAIDALDALVQSNVRRIIKVSNTNGGPADYSDGKQFQLTADQLDWSLTAQLIAPILETPVVDLAGTLGTWAATGVHFFVITAINGNGETLQSAEVSATVVATTDEVLLRWSRVPNATGYSIYESVTTGDYTGPNALLVAIADGAVTSFNALIEAAGAGVLPSSNDADDEPTVAGTYYVTYEYAEFAANEGKPIRYTSLADVFDDHGIGSQLAQVAELAMSTQTGRGNRTPAVWLAGVESDLAVSYQNALTNFEAVLGEVLILTMDKRDAILDVNFRDHIIKMNGVEERRERVGVMWSAPGTGIGATGTPGTLLADANDSQSFDMLHVAPDSGSATVLIADTAGVYAETQAQGWHIAAAVMGMAGALPDAAEPFTRKPITALVAMQATEYTDSQLKQLRSGGVIVVDNVNGAWRILEGTTTLRSGLQEEKYPNISLADKVVAQLWRNQIDPGQNNVFTRRSLIGRKITDSLLEMVFVRTVEALDVSLQRGLISSYDRNSIVVQQNGVTKTQIDVAFSYVAFFPSLVIISERSFDTVG